MRKFAILIGPEDGYKILFGFDWFRLPFNINIYFRQFSMETLEMLYEEVARVSNNHKEPLQIIFDFGDGKEVVVGVISELVYVPHCSDLQLRDFKMRFYARQFFHQITNGLSEILSCVP